MKRFDQHVVRRVHGLALAKQSARAWLVLLFEDPTSSFASQALHAVLATLTFGSTVLLVMLTFFGMGFGIVDSLLFVYLKDEFGASKLLCGLTVTANVVFEIPIFYYAKQIQAAMGHQAMVAVALLAYSTRVYGYTLLTAGNYKLVLALEGLHGLTFAMMWTATVAIATKISPPEWRSATMAVVQAFMGCLGWGGGSAVGGWAAQQYGFRPMFRVAACTFAGLQVLHLASWKLGVFKF